MAIKFDITFNCSPYATQGMLYYRHILPNGSYSPWVLDTTSGLFIINTMGGTVTTHTLYDVAGVSPDFLPATVYEFYIEQLCSNGETEPSDPSTDVYVEGCPDFTVVMDNSFNPQQASYDLVVTLYDLAGAGFPMNPNAYSVFSYLFTVYETTPTGLLDIGTAVVNYADILAVLPTNSYTFHIQSSDLINPIVGGVLYEVQLSMELVTSTGAYITYECPNRVKVFISECDTYKVYTGKSWVIQYTDCNSQVRKIGGSASMDPFYICAKSIPLGYWCLNGVQKAPVNTSGGVIHQIGQCVATGSGGTYTIDQGAVIECSPGPGCDPAYLVPFPTNIQNQIPPSQWTTAAVTQSVAC